MASVAARHVFLICLHNCNFSSIKIPRSRASDTGSMDEVPITQGWIKCGSGEHRSQEMTRKIEEIVTLGYEEKEKKEKRKKRKRGKERKEEVEIEEFSEEKEEHGDDKLL